MYTLFYILSLLPLRLLYCISDVVARLAHRVVRYRVKVVRDNLASSFPNKSVGELRRIERDFYHFLGDYFVETVKMTTMSRKEMERRFRLENPELVNDSMARGESCSLFLGHFCNWEWASSMALHYHGGISAQVYHPLENANADRAFLRIRSRWGARNLTMAETARTLMHWAKEGTVSVVGYIADQAPMYNGIVLLEFLNHPTAFFGGGEKITLRTKAKAFYLDMHRPRRGYYSARLIPISTEGDYRDLTARYAAMLEDNIRRHPHLWLWSHRRWKRSYDIKELYKPEAEK